MKKPFPRRHGQVRALTTHQLNQLTQTDLNKLAEFAERRMGGLPRARVAAEDVVQKALLAILRGTRKGGQGRRPPREAVRNKDAFLHYVRSAINSVVEATRRPRELRFIHETIDRQMDPESHERVIVPAALPSPDTDPAMVDLKQELLANHEFGLADMGERFLRWMNNGLWTAWGEPFDVGIATSTALLRIANGTPADQAGGQDEHDNGNGSLMRILPVVLRFAAEPIELFADRVEKVSAITHSHDRARMACVFYGLVVRQLLLGWQIRVALDSARVEFTGWYERSASFPHFRHILEDDLASLPEGEIVSTGYVLHTLHASLWCLLKTQSFQDCVLKAVNLSGDTDTTGCVAGGLAGVAYGMKSIPVDWIGQLARRADVDCLFQKFADVCEDTGMKSVS